MCQISLFIYIVHINWDDRQGKINCSCQNCHIKIFNFTNFVSVPNSVGVYLKIKKCSRIWDGDQYKKLKHDLQGVFKISPWFFIVNIKWEDLLKVTECLRQNYHIEILSLTIFVPVPNFGNLHLKMAKWVRIWDGDKYKKIVYPIYRVFQISLLIYKVNIKWDHLQYIIDCSFQIGTLKFNFSQILCPSQIPEKYILKS